MEMYRKAYQCYTIACENYGIEVMNFHYFITHLTEEQLSEYSKMTIKNKGCDHYGSLN